MLLKDKIVSVRPREKSGAISGSRFDFQKDWSICQLLQYHESQSDYVIIFDWQEDLIVMDSEQNPNKVSFYQVKGKQSGNWTLNNLIKSEKDKDGNPLLSIIGKLYDCKAKFEIETFSLNFVSNARFNVKLEDKMSSISKDNICIVELLKSEKEEIKRKIISEHNLNVDPIFEDISFLKVLDLSLDDSPTHTKGRISDFLDKLFHDRKFHVPSVYRMLFDEVRRRASYHKDILTYTDLITNKGIGRSQFERIIQATCINKDYDDIWNRAEIILYRDGLMYNDIRKLKRQWKKLELERMNPQNDYLVKLNGSIISIYEELESQNIFNTTNLVESMDRIFIVFRERTIFPISYDEFFVKAIILSELYD
jgi:hypothetical protein